MGAIRQSSSHTPTRWSPARRTGPPRAETIGVTMAQPVDIDLDTLDRMARELLGREFPREWLEKFKVQLDGVLEETSRLDELDLTDVEPARVFRNALFIQ